MEYSDKNLLYFILFYFPSPTLFPSFFLDKLNYPLWVGLAQQAHWIEK